MKNTQEDTNNNLPDDTTSKVSRSSKKNIAIIASFCLVVAITLFFILSSDDDKKQEQNNDTEVPLDVNISKKEQIRKTASNTKKTSSQKPTKVKIIPDEKTIEKSAANINKNSNKSPDLPSLPLANDKKVAVPIVVNPDNNNDPKLIATKRNARLKSSIMLINNSSAQEPGKNANTENNVDVVYQGDTSYLLSYGKIINAVLETSLNSDFHGEARAIITEDVFAQRGRKILIPRGARIVGTYSVLETSGYGRMNIAWSTIYLPNGYAVNLGQANAVDNLGVPGVEARVDDKAFEKILNAMLVSGFSIGIAKGLDKMVDPPQNSHKMNQQTAKSQALLNYSSGVMNNPNLTAQAKIQMLCSSVYSYMDDPTSPSYTQIQQTCNQVNLNISGTTPDQQLTTVMSAINTAAVSLTQDSVKDAQPTRTNQAVKDAYQNITNTLKDMVNENNFKTVVTVPQGKEIKIYVNKSIVFPKESVDKVRLIQ